MKTIKVRTAKPNMVMPLVAGVGHNTVARSITHEEPVEVYLDAMIQRRLAKGDLVEVVEKPVKRKSGSSPNKKEA